MNRRPPGLRFAAAIGLTVLLVGTSAAAGYAFWTAQTSKTVDVSAATVSVSANGIDGLTAKYTAGIPSVFSPVLSDTAPVAVSNTGTSPLAITMTVAGGTPALNSAITVQIWKQGTTCTDATTPESATSSTGTLAAPPTLNPAIGTVPPGSALNLCVRTTLTGTFPSSEQSTIPTMGFTGKIGTSWTTSTTAVTFTQRVAFDWFQLVQSGPGKCFQTASTAAAAAAQDIVNADCGAPQPTNNQSFRLVSSGNGYYRILPGTGASTGPVVSGRPSSFFGIIPSVVELATQSSGTGQAALRQQWQPLPHGDAGDFQLLNREANLCLTMPSTANNTTATITTCSTTTDSSSTAYRNQHFQLTPIP